MQGLFSYIKVMKISYGITVCNELKEIERLVSFLLKHKREEDEIVVLFDNMGGTDEVLAYLRSMLTQGTGYHWHCYPFDGHFDRFKNHLTALCTGDYIINIDADELPTQTFVENIPTVLEENDIDMIMIPRVNTVEGLTEEHIKKWRWNVNEKGWVNWPDAQQRIYKNNGSIKWVNKVHEVLEGYKTKTNLPIQEEWAFLHDKKIERQERQNAYYETL